MFATWTFLAREEGSIEPRWDPPGAIEKIILDRADLIFFECAYRLASVRIDADRRTHRLRARHTAAQELAAMVELRNSQRPIVLDGPDNGVEARNETVMKYA